MKTVLYILFFILSFYAEGSQPCEGAKEFSEIEKLYDQGYFNKVLAETKILEDCPSLSEEQYQQLLILNYKCYRNVRRGRKARAALETLKAYKESKNIALDFETVLLLAEMYALRREREKHRYYAQILEDSLFSTPNASNADLGRFYLIKYYGFEREQAFGDAMTIAQKALSHFQKVEEPMLYHKGNTLRGLGNMNRNHGDFDKSISYYEQELTLYEAHYNQDHFDIAVCHFNLGNVYYEKLEFENALDHFLKAHKTWSTIYQPQDRYMKMLNEAIGDMYWELDDHENALIYFNDAVLDEKQINNDTSEITLRAADSLLESGNYHSAMDFYKEALAWREKTFGKEHTLTGACKNFVARAVRASGDTREALVAYQEAIGILVEEIKGDDIYENPNMNMHIRSYQYLLESLMAKGELMATLFSESNSLKDLKAALDTHEVALGILEKMKNGHMSETSKIFWTQRTLSLVENSIETALQLYAQTEDTSYLEKAFGFSEKSKALLLLASLEDNDKTQFVNIPENIITAEQSLKKEITTYIGKMENEEKRCAQVRDKMLKLYRDKLQALQGDYDVLVNEIRNDYPDYYHLKFEAKVTSLKEIRSALGAETDLISYFVGDHNSYVFHVNASHISVRRIENATDLQQKASNLFGLLNSKSSFQTNPQEAYEKFVAQSFTLYQILLQPELEVSESSKLIIVPDGLLSYLPFDILLTQPIKVSTRNYQTLPYLLKEYALSYSPSASIKAHSKNTSTAPSNYLGFAPRYQGEVYSEERKTLSNLQYNGSEVAFATTLFNGESWIGNQVNEEILKDRSDQAGIIHLAMHGEVEDEHPLLSRLYFSPSIKEDGLLYTYEIYNMTIPAQLVILSACNTATGALQRGEGILSLERAFQYAGSQSLLSTLWTVDDRASAELTQNFLQHLKEGKTKDIALQEAKLEFLNSATPDKLHPFYWSSFKLTGNTEVLARENFLRYLWIALGVLGLLLVYYFRKEKAI
ncbi:MAG: CHAT domain-containing tetratricopeptide repeat protein [Bacteroidota bacterium]